MSETKTLAVEVKDATQGTVQAVIATLNVVDHDGDVTVPGAFKDGQEIVIGAYNHASYIAGAPPVGKGVIRERDGKAILDGQFFLDTTHGRDMFTTVKELGALGQWSYSYDSESERGEFQGKSVRFLKSIQVHEASPVLLGAGIGTETLAAKELKVAIPAHSTATSDASWDGPAAKTNLDNDGTAVYYRSAFAWVDSAADAEVKSSYKFIHHEVSADGAVGAANITACVTGVGVLNGGRTGTTIPDADRKGVYNHLAKHIRDAGSEPPELRSKSLTFPDQYLHLLGDAAGLVDRLKAWGLGADQKEGRVLSAANRQRLQALQSAMTDLMGEVDTMLADTDPNKHRRAVESEFLRFQHALANH